MHSLQDHAGIDNACVFCCKSQIWGIPSESNAALLTYIMAVEFCMISLGLACDMKACSPCLSGKVQCDYCNCLESCCREDLEKQAELAPERYKDHSTAYLAGKPPAAASTLLPGGPAGSHDEDSD